MQSNRRRARHYLKTIDRRIQYLRHKVQASKNPGALGFEQAELSALEWVENEIIKAYNLPASETEVHRATRGTRDESTESEVDQIGGGN